MKQIFKTASRRIEEIESIDPENTTFASAGAALAGRSVGMLDVIAGRIADHVNNKNSNPEYTINYIAALLVDNGYLAR